MIKGYGLHFLLFNLDFNLLLTNRDLKFENIHA